eukprot:jgi/Picre1/29982/NNA_005358.t1
MPNESEDLLGSLLDDIETRTDDRKLTLSFLKEFLDNMTRLGTCSISIPRVGGLWGISRINFNYMRIVSMIQQRLKRNAMFRPTKWGRLSKQGDVAELTELKSLLGHERERKFVVGFLTKHDEGQYYIEDLSARLPIDLTVCDTADGLFTENCVVVAEGELMPGGDFRAIALGLPPAESREESIEALQGHDLFGATRPGSQEPEKKSEEEDDGDRIVFLSDVHLEIPRILVLGICCPNEAFPRQLHKVCCSMSPKPRLQATHYGCDTGDPISYSSDPTCKQLLRGLSILPPPMPSFSEDGEDYMRHAAFFFDQTCSTVIQESHLCPVPLDYQPIIWEWDHSLYIYPNPHGLILADSEPAAECVFDTCHCLNPGPLASGSFGAWNPSEGVMELCHVNEPEEDDEEEEDEAVLEDTMPEAKDTRPVKKHAHIDGYFKAQEDSDVNENVNESQGTPDMEEDLWCEKIPTTKMI